jgi:hypothetical protein
LFVITPFNFCSRQLMFLCSFIHTHRFKNVSVFWHWKIFKYQTTFLVSLPKHKLTNHLVCLWVG